MPKKSKIVKILQVLNLAVFTIGVGAIILLHTFTENFLDFLRLPQLIYALDPLFGFGWPASLHTYQVILAFSLILVLVDGLGLFFYSSRSWRILTDTTSFLGFLIIWPVALFFLYSMASASNLKFINFQTNIAYFGLAFFLFLLDLITWFVDDQSLIKTRRK